MKHKMVTVDFIVLRKNKYALENLLFEKFGLPYSSLDKFLDPDNSNVYYSY